jgi:hypothetical protein
MFTLVSEYVYAVIDPNVAGNALPEIGLAAHPSVVAAELKNAA